ncbi:MAG: phospholipid carrier-dependent glycosyltransferase [Cyanobacteria bacterium P01_E01_bin.45]
MTVVPPHSRFQQSPPARDRRLILGMVAVWAIALGMRLWRLGALEPPVFDEVYFPVFAQNYLDGIVPFDVHPPLGKYEIALGILAFGPTPLGMRISTALAGSLIPVAAAGLVYQLTDRARLARVAGCLMLVEGLCLVESRFGLMNVWLVLFGLTAQIYAIAGLRARGWKRTGLLAGCGALLGASVSVKWSGLGYALGLGGMGIVAVGTHLVLQQWGLSGREASQVLKQRLGVWGRVRSLHWWQYVFCLGVIPLSVYVIQWLPHIWLLAKAPPDSTGAFSTNTLSISTFAQQLADIHSQMLGGHANATPPTAGGDPVHPYCSTWWSWPFLGRPIAYFFQDDGNLWRAIYALGNPVLWWSSTVAIASLWVSNVRTSNGVSLYLVISYIANWLPWALVGRCIFLYHYMGSLVFSVLALALILERWLYHPRHLHRWLGWNLAIAILGCAIFFAPLWLGLPLSPDALYRRLWFQGRWLLEFNWI